MNEAKLKAVAWHGDEASGAEVEAMAREVLHLRQQRDQLQAKCSAQLLELRALKQGRTALSGQVEAFMHLFDQRVGAFVGDVTADVARLAVLLVVEEALEFAEAVLELRPEDRAMKASVLDTLKASRVALRFPEAVDALLDGQYVHTWALLAFGIQDERELADEVQRANISKVGGEKDPETGKKRKPAGWTPPDIVGVLRKMGWSP